jgi:hypothetical protein
MNNIYEFDKNQKVLLSHGLGIYIEMIKLGHLKEWVESGQICLHFIWSIITINWLHREIFYFLWRTWF